MQQQSTTELIRIDKDLLDKIRYISKQKGQTISGYLNVNIKKQIDKDWSKFNSHEKSI